LFTFTVGANKREFTVHSSALAGLSQSLNALMNGEMIEAKTRHADWPEVDEDTFARLCEFGYFRNYTPPSFRLFEGKSAPSEVRKAAKPKKKAKKSRSHVEWDEIFPEATAEPEPVPEPVIEPEPEPEPYPTSQAPEYNFSSDPEIPYKERSVWTGQLRDAFQGGLSILSPSSSGSNDTFASPSNTGSWEDFTPVFLEQAQLYVLADKYGIEQLCQMVISKLHHTLTSFKLYDTGVSGVIELVRFVYLNTPPNHGGRVDSMRNLVTRYVVSVLGQVGEKECFQELLEEGGPFVSDLWNIIWSIQKGITE
jgi:hypothetical protein